MLNQTAQGQPVAVWIVAVLIVVALALTAGVGFAMHHRRPWWQ